MIRVIKVAGIVNAFVFAATLTACSNLQYTNRWDGRRGYDGHSDYGYDPAASNAEARQYRSRAARSYAVPGGTEDPWGRYVHEASYRFRVPEQWVREVMNQESGGRLNDADGSLITSSAGAMGLMQVMPQTFNELQQRYQLGDDPYEPRNNILAGIAYIREMYDRYGSPGFLAAYNAGPDRVDAYLAERLSSVACATIGVTCRASSPITAAMSWMLPCQRHEFHWK